MDNSIDSLFTYPCTIGNTNTTLTALIDTCAMGGNFIYFQTARALCKTNNLSLNTLRTPIQIQGFNGQPAPSITYKLSVPLVVGRHSQPTYDFFVTDLGRNDLIIGNKWLKEHGAIVVPSSGDIWFIGDYCHHPGAPPALTELPSLPIDSITVERSADVDLPKKKRSHRAPQYTPNQILRRKESDRINNATTPFQRSTRYTLPKEVNEDKAEEYYES